MIEDNRSTGQKSFRFVKGPVLPISCSLMRSTAPPKTQAALLEAMQGMV
ncbi:MAG: hypothetical protein IPM83_16235 [Ignavibacteria bacterium]|nr:hypothetical protein [Ignavibacteria bacterium]